MPFYVKYCIAGWLFFLSVAPVWAAQPLVFSTIEGGAVSRIIMPILTSAYDQLGIEIEFKFYPASRGVLVANSGLYDGETFRGMDFIDEENNLLPVMVVVAEVDWWVYSKHVQFKVDGYQSLAPYRVSSRRGILAADNILQFSRKKQMLNTFKQALQTLDAERVDLAIIPARVALKILKDTPMNIYPLKPPIRVDKLYHFLHKKHKGLIPKITKVLKEMEKSGEIKRLWALPEYRQR
jgi:polar amino acid transport system substrate-binding protein